MLKISDQYNNINFDSITLLYYAVDDTIIITGHGESSKNCKESNANIALCSFTDIYKIQTTSYISVLLLVTC